VFLQLGLLPARFKVQVLHLRVQGDLVTFQNAETAQEILSIVDATCHSDSPNHRFYNIGKLLVVNRPFTLHGNPLIFLYLFVPRLTLFLDLRLDLTVHDFRAVTDHLEWAHFDLRTNLNSPQHRCVILLVKKAFKLASELLAGAVGRWLGPWMLHSVGDLG
jgi:hypothetical protein